MKENKQIAKRNEKGITLIALVITIIVLLILAGVSIATLTGDNGLLTQANNANVKQSHGAVKEGIELLYNQYQIEINTASNTKLASRETIQIQGQEEKAFADTSMTFLEFLQGGNAQGINYFKTDNIINVEVLTGGKQALGNGTGTDDVYKFEESDEGYSVVYYEEETKTTLISTIPNIGSWDKIATDYKYFTFTLNEDTKTATLTGVKDEYAEKDNYYSSSLGETYIYTTAILDGDEQITDIVIPKYMIDESGVKYEVTAIGAWAFAGGNSDGPATPSSTFTSFKIPDTVTTISSSAFRHCDGVNQFDIYGEIQTMGSYAFGNLSSSQIINFKMSSEPVTGWDGYWVSGFSSSPQINWGVEM